VAVLAPGFPDPVGNAQRVFRVVMDAMARPGVVRRLPVDLSPPAPLGRGAAALALALLDFETPVWLDERLSAAPEVQRWLKFHTGAPLVTEGARAAFGFVADAALLPPFPAFGPGTPEYPDRSTTVIAAVAAFEGGVPLRLAGPGIAGSRLFAPSPLPVDFAARWNANRALFPCGVDLLLVADDRVAALPRSTRIETGR
jgi:alpha-D-ribose 1-methylphosphonate 5-triphosphate synthase subunit PhnH